MLLLVVAIVPKNMQLDRNILKFCKFRVYHLIGKTLLRILFIKTKFQYDKERLIRLE